MDMVGVTIRVRPKKMNVGRLLGLVWPAGIISYGLNWPTSDLE